MQSLGRVLVITDHYVVQLEVIVYHSSLMDLPELLNQLDANLTHSLQRKWLVPYEQVLLESLS
jgi:hypothetical protein